MPKKSHPIFIAIFIFCFLCIFLLTGCRCGLDTQRIDGTVLYDGVPIEGLTIGFSPAIRGEGLPAFVRSDANGRFTITSVQGGKAGAGSLTGRYAVSFTKMVPSREMTQAELKILDEQGIAPNIPLVSAIPEHYGDPKISTTHVDVVRGKNTYTFELTSQKQ